jgi:hypothetical protein
LQFPYNGGEIGEFIGDAIRNIWGGALPITPDNQMSASDSSGALYWDNVASGLGVYIVNGFWTNYSVLRFDASHCPNVITSYENRSASISRLEYISY